MRVARVLVVVGVLTACTGGAQPAEPWQVVSEGLGGALLSVTGSSARDVWAVGADDGGGPLVLQWDGAGWTRHTTGSAGDLWWAWRPPAAGRTHELWAAGAGGRVLRLDEAGWHEDVLEEGLILWGVWGASEDEVWAVGGDPTAASGTAALFRFFEGEWSRQDLPTEAAEQVALYKVWGSGPDDVWACGASGVIVHWDGAAWSVVPSGTERLLLTVAGADAEHVWAVGGTGSGEIVRWDGSAWASEAPEFSTDFSGVSARGERAVAVGRVGDVWWSDGAGWVHDERERALYEDLHAAWLDPDGGVWAVGGKFSSLPMTSGAMLYAGPDEVAAYTP